jgi:plasmid stabilization system protein ParE
MKYRVIVQPPALEDLEEAYLWAVQRAPQTAPRWYRRFWMALQTLDQNPQRCGLARVISRLGVAGFARIQISHQLH